LQHRRLGSTALSVSVLGLGCNNFGARLDLVTTRAVVHKALDLGITLFDTADIYGERGGSEQLLGEVLGARRKDIILATKFGLPMDSSGQQQGGSRRYVMSAIEASLKRLKTDYIDLYYLHRPDPTVSIEETLRALTDLVSQGKVRFVGCSNLAAWQVVEADWTSRTHGLSRFACCQDQYSLLARRVERELLPAARAYALSLVPYFPLASGLLSGKYRRDAPLPSGTRLGSARYSDRFLNERNWRILERLDTFCVARGRGMLELAFSWLLANPLVPSVIAGASSPEQLTQNAQACGWQLSANDVAEIDQITRD
jgi:aryl-alcohol dehydrogenase-like predicted oxidoreductase